MSQDDTTFNPKINVSHCDLYFMVQWFCLISWRLFDIWTPYFEIMSQYDPMFDLKIFVGHCDLYFIVQWFYIIISWKLFSDWRSHFGIMSQYDPTSDLKIFVGLHTCQIPRRGKNLMVFPPILWSFGGGCRSHGFWKNRFFFYFRYIWFILESFGRKQADFMGGSRLKITPQVSFCWDLLKVKFSPLCKHQLSRHLVTDCQLMHHWSRTSKQGYRKPIFCRFRPIFSL